MILPEINQKMPIYRDCTLVEVMVVSFICIISLMLLLVPTTIILFGYGWIGAVLALVLWVPVSKFFLARLQKLKFGKPYGYYQHILLKSLSNSPLASWLPISFVQRLGKWSVRRQK
jgi:conjugative transfer region protein (TIGR03750 family)